MTEVSSATPPELLAPAGDWQCARAAIENGANAIYFGLDCGFNARHRATNFHLDDLSELMSELHGRGVRGYATMNTLVFPSEMPRLVQVIEQLARSGVDAVLVQDFGVARLVHSICSEMKIHASTQMSLTSAETIRVAEQLGISRVVLARELSVAEITTIASQTAMPLEVFIHGALCVAYSGQCLTSESLGGRSANRGQCAQACRLPYEIVCDRENVELGDVRYLLSPQDLAGYDSIVALIKAGIASLKIEGRLKTPEYVANTTSFYRRAIDQAIRQGIVQPTMKEKEELELSFSRGFTPGWLEGNDHKRLVPGLHSAKRGIRLGQVQAITGDRIRIRVEASVRRGDGLGIESTRTDSSEQAMHGGRVFSIQDDQGKKVDCLEKGSLGWIGFGRGEIDWATVREDAVIFKNDDPQLNRRLRASFNVADPVTRMDLDFEVFARSGRPLRVTARTSMDGSCDLVETLESTDLLQVARKHPATESMFREKLARLGATPFRLHSVEATIQDAPMVPASLLNELRRQVVDRLIGRLRAKPTRKIDMATGRQLLQPLPRERSPDSHPHLAVMCRSLEQVRGAVETSCELIYVDFHDIREYRLVADIVRPSKKRFAIASVRIQKPGEMGLLRVLARHRPDLILARNLAAIDFASRESIPAIADFSLNVANHHSAQWLNSLGVERMTASYDLNRDQLDDLIHSVPPEWMEVVLHQHIPMFHMEHCVFCSVLSPGTNKTNCGRPCDRHSVVLRDRVGAEHPLHADVACRNTLFNAVAQSGAETVPGLIDSGVRWFRVELLNETAEQCKRTVALYLDLLSGRVSSEAVWRTLGAMNRLGVTRGTLETKRNPLAVL